MRVSRVRIGVRWMMVLVAVSAVLALFEARRRKLEELAAYHAIRGTLGGPMSGDQRGAWGTDSLGNPVTDWELRYHRGLAEKYGHAARRPWLFVGPDPDREAFREEYRARVLREGIPLEPLRSVPRPVVAPAAEEVPQAG